jgi:hypothetical protein
MPIRPIADAIFLATMFWSRQVFRKELLVRLPVCIADDCAVPADRVLAGINELSRGRKR